MTATMLSVPVGAVIDYAGERAPAGYLECDGSAVSRSGYPALFAAIGTAWGEGDGSTTFNLPDFRGRTSIGAGTGTAGGATAHALASTGGDERMHKHSHTMNSSGYVANGITGGSHRHNVALYNATWTTNNVTGVMNAAAWGKYSANGGSGFRAASSNATDATHVHNLPNHTHTMQDAGGRLAEHAALRDGPQAHQGGVTHGRGR